MKIICFLSFLLIANITALKSKDRPMIEAQYAVDSNSTWHISDLPTKKFTPFGKSQLLNIGYNKNASVWCLFKISNKSPGHVSTWLTFGNNHIDSLVLYADKRPVKILGDRTKNISPFLEALAFEVSLKPNEERTFYVRVKKLTSYLEFSYALKDSEELSHKSTIRTVLTSFLLGAIFLLLLFNAILFYISGKRLFLYYILHSVLGAIYITISLNYARHMFFPEFTYFSEVRIYVSALWCIGISAFLCHYLDLKKHQPRKYQTVFSISIANLTIIIITLILLILRQPYLLKFFTITGYINFLIIMCVICWSTLLHFKINKEAASYISISFLPQMLWGLCAILKSFDIISKEIHPDWLVIITLFEIFLFGYVLTKNYMETFLKNNALIKEIILEKENSLKSITQAQIRERRNIANIIHDNFGSKIAYILQLIQLKNFDRANENIQELASDIREISHQILPKSLDDGALAASLKSQIESLNAALTSSKIELFNYDFPGKLVEPWIYDLYLITLEIINNALKHGRSKTVSIELYQYPDYYVFQYTDDGCGFDTQKMTPGFGLENIEKRVNYYRGSFELNSSPEQGTVIQISIPKEGGTNG